MKAQDVKDYVVVLISRRRIPLTAAEATGIFLHPWVMLIYSLLTFGIVLLNEHPWTQDLPLWLRTPIYFLSSAAGLLVAWATQRAQFWAVRRGIFQNVHAIVFDLTGATASMLVTHALLIGIGVAPTPFTLLHALLFVKYYVVVGHVSFFLWALLVPRLLSEMRQDRQETSQVVADFERMRDASPEETDSAPDASAPSIGPFAEGVVVVGGKRILAATISHVEAQGNYVKIHTTERDYFEAGSMQEIVAQLPSRLGMRVHRSHWVRYSAIHAFTSEGRNMKIALLSGAEVPVSRSNLDLLRKLKLAAELGLKGPLAS